MKTLIDSRTLIMLIVISSETSMQVNVGSKCYYTFLSIIRFLSNKADFKDHYKVSKSHRSGNESHIEESDRDEHIDEEPEIKNSENERVSLYQGAPAPEAPGNVSEPDNSNCSKDIVLSQVMEVRLLMFII
jgi:hypothetical protein